MSFSDFSDENSLLSTGTYDDEISSSEKQLGIRGNTSEANSFKDLDSQIESSLNEVNLTQDYLFDDESDSNFTNGIKITYNNIVIDGFDHVIDANGNARIFNIAGSNVTLTLLCKNSPVSLSRR